MKKKILSYLTFVGLALLVFACEKDETRVVMMENPTAPTIVSMPNLTLQRANANNVLVFIGTPVDPGFAASANYFLEACATGNNFADAVVLYSGTKNDTIRMTVSDINGLLLKKFPADQTSSVDFRMRAVLVVDAGTGALGTSTSPLSYSSPAKTASVTIYGLPRLDLVNSGMTQKVESTLGDGKYKGFVKFDVTKPYTLTNPDAAINYGGTAGVLSVNGPAITPPANGWHRLSVDVPALTYTMESFMIGLVGSATPNGWDSPDSKMDYNPQTGTWSITIDLVVGEFKFRFNDGWAWNLGGTPGALVHDGPNCPLTVAGNYTITLTITDFVGEKGTYTIVKN